MFNADAAMTAQDAPRPAWRPRGLEWLTPSHLASRPGLPADTAAAALMALTAARSPHGLRPPSGERASVLILLNRHTRGIREILVRLRRAAGGGPMFLDDLDLERGHLAVEVGPAQGAAILAQLHAGAVDPRISMAVMLAAEGPDDGDRRLVRRALEGEPGAQLDLYRRMMPAARLAVARVMGWRSPIEQREDAMQEALLAIFSSVEGFMGLGSLEGWGFGIACNHARRHLAREARARQKGLRVRKLELSSMLRPADPFEILEARRTLGLVLSTYPRILSRQQQVVFEEVALQGRDTVKAGANLHRPAVHVRVVMHQARQTLSVYLLRHREALSSAAIASQVGMDAQEVDRRLASIHRALRAGPPPSRPTPCSTSALLAEAM